MTIREARWVVRMMIRARGGKVSKVSPEAITEVAKAIKARVAKELAR